MMSRFFLPAAVVLSGCIENGLQVTEPDPDDYRPGIEVSPSILDFGAPNLGAQEVRTFTISSVGDEPLALEGFDAPDAWYVSAPPVSFLQPGERLEVDVYYSGDGIARADQLLVLSDDPFKPEVPVDLYVDAGGADYAFGTVTGKICETFETGLSGVTVAIEHPYGVATDVTDADGMFTLSYVPGGTHTLVANGASYFDQFEVYVSPNETTEVATDECAPSDCEIPIPCIGLAEAFDREIAQVSLTADGIRIRNSSDELDVCLEDWMVFISEVSQDAIAGQEVDVRIQPNGERLYPYSADVYGTAAAFAWWCIERWQYTAVGSEYDYNGSLAPVVLHNWVQDRTDSDGDGLEDHVDFEDLALRTQYNIWDTEAENPVIIVGRDRSLVRIEGDAVKPQVEVQVKNIGVQDGEASVYEIIPPGFAVSDVRPAGTVTEYADGTTTIRWDVELSGSRPDYDLVGLQTWYDVELLTYRLQAQEEACVGRCEGRSARADWSDLDGNSWLSESEPLIIEHCP